MGGRSNVSNRVYAKQKCKTWATPLRPLYGLDESEMAVQKPHPCETFLASEAITALAAGVYDLREIVALIEGEDGVEQWISALTGP